LPSSVNPEKATATYKNGTLEILLPKQEQERAKKVQVEVK